MKFFNNLKIVYKILLLVGFLSVITAGIGYAGFSAVHTINRKSDDQAVSANETNSAHMIYEEILRLNSTTDDLASDPSADNVAKNEIIRKDAEKVISENLEKVQASADETQAELLKKFSESYKSYLPALDKVFSLAAGSETEDKTAKVTGAMQDSEALMAPLRNTAKNYIDYTFKQGEIVCDEATAAYNQAKKTLTFSIIAAILTGIAGSLLLAIYGISKPTGQSVEVLQHLIKGNLEVEINGADRNDEIGDVARAAKTFKDVLVKNRAMAEAEKIEQAKKEERQKRMEALISRFDSSATQTVSTVSSASTQLSQTAEHMSQIAGTTNKQSVDVASASEQASQNVQSVATAAEEMSSTVQEISRQVATSNDIVRKAMDKAEVANSSSQELVEMSQSVGAIASLIEDIAGQINLLALNATIESARSGEAGKGFAVVANEVKNLASQTAKATEQIRSQLEGVQKTASGVASVLGEVRTAITQVSESSAAIAAAVEEQATATQEIVANMNTATQGVEQINSGIFSIKGGTDSTTAATRQVLDAARMLSNQAEKMDSEVKTFLRDILAA